MGIKDLKELSKSTRVFFLIFFSILLFLVLFIVRGHLLPKPEDGLWFQFGLLLVVLGSFFLEPYFTKPTDVVANSIAVIVTLLAVSGRSDFILWKIMILISVTLLILALLSMILSKIDLDERSFRLRASKLFYNISTFLGQGRLLFSIIFILAVVSYFPTGSREFMYLILFWGFIIITGPSGLANLVDKIINTIKGKHTQTIGTVIGIIQPNIVLAKYSKETKNLSRLQPVLVHMPELDQMGKIGISLGDLILEDEKWARILLIEGDGINLPRDITDDEGTIYYKKGSISSVSEEKIPENIKQSFLWKNRDNIVGFVEEKSNIRRLIFEVFSNPDVELEEGHLLKIRTRGRDVYYQILDGITESETLKKENKSGFIRGNAQQLGTWNQMTRGFDNFGWVPPLNSPIYIVKENEEVQFSLDSGEYILGNIPKSNFPVIYNIEELISHHTAILGITGCGKTWLAYSLIEEISKSAFKIICIDFTNDYKDDLANLNPVELGTKKEIDRINEYLEDAEEKRRNKKELEYKNKIKEVNSDLKKIIEKYMNSQDNIAIFELPDISISLGILEFTQMFLQNIFDFARENRGEQKICIVLEEAHTVIPEPGTFTGVWGDYGASKQIVGKISQIALQGRKYNVGFLVIAQRTANVTKTVLNQCNSIIAFNAFDETGMKFLCNYLGEDMVKIIPNLKDYQAVTVGKAFKSKNPLIIQIPKKERPITKEIEDEEEDVPF